MTKKELRRRLRELGVTVRRIWIDEDGHLAVMADTPAVHDEERAVLSSRVTLLFSEYHKSRGGSGLRCAAPTEWTVPGDTSDEGSEDRG